MRDLGCGCFTLLAMIVASSVIVLCCNSVFGVEPFGWIIALVTATNIWIFRYAFAEEDKSQWPAEGNRGARVALNTSLFALTVQNPMALDWLYRRMYPPQTGAFVGWAFVLGLSILAVALSLRVLAVQVHYRGKHIGTAVLASALSCWAAILAFSLVREASS